MKVSLIISNILMKVQTWSKSLLYNASITIIAALIIGIMLNFLWAPLYPPFPIPRVSPAITAPVDGPFYLHNADYGYSWSAKDIHILTLSFWYHPLLSWIVAILPRVLPISALLPSNIRFWLISLTFAFGCLILIYYLITTLAKQGQVSPKLLPLILLVPGGLEIATGNAEIPTLYFTLCLLLSILKWQKWYLTVIYASLAILTKPNALYMIPILAVYLIVGWKEHNNALRNQAIIGIIVLIGVWGLWIGYIGWRTGQLDLYFRLRTLTSQWGYAAHDFKGFFHRLGSSFLYSDDFIERLHYLTALIIPIANFLLIGLIPLEKERHRYAMVSGNLAMLLIALYTGNPNKIIVYATTLPGYFVMHLLVINQLTTKTSASGSFRHVAAIAIYSIYCAAMFIFYILGTPLGWYY